MIKKLLIILFLMFFAPANVFAAAADMYVSPDAAGGGTGLSWAQAWTFTEFETDLEASSESGDQYFIEGGGAGYTYSTLSTARDGSATSPIAIIGVTAGTTAEPPTSSDWATGDDRPLFAMSTGFMNLDNYWKIQNIRYTSTYTGDNVRCDLGCQFLNNKGENSSAGTTGFTFTTQGASSRVINNELVNTNGWALEVQANAFVAGNYIHDSDNGVDLLASEVILIDNEFDTITDDCLDGGLNDRTVIYGNTFYNCTNGIEFTSGATDTLAMNNIFHTTTDAVTFSSTMYNDYLDYNSFYNNTTDVTFATKGANTVSADPEFTDAAGGDFSVGTNLKAVGFPGAFPGGLSTSYKDIGAVQRQEPAGGGGGSGGTSYTFVK